MKTCECKETIKKTKDANVEMQKHVFKDGTNLPQECCSTPKPPNLQPSQAGLCD